MTEDGSSDFDMEQCLGQLPTFLSVAQTGSIAKSSEKIFKASSAVARSIRELETAIGYALFDRVPRGMMLNPFGLAVLRRAERIQSVIAQTADEMLRARADVRPSEKSVLLNLLYSGRKLHLLIHIAQMRHLSGAAERMGLTQAGASMALSRIESALAVPLFHRMMQGMVATDAADKVINAGKRIFAELRHLHSDISAMTGELGGLVVVGALPLGRTFVVPAAIADTLKAHGKLHIRTIEGPYETLAAALRTGEIDMIFGAVRDEAATPGLVVEPLFHDRIGILARTGHPLARRSAIALQDLLREQWILPRPDAPGRKVVDDSFHELALEPPVPSVECGDLAIVRQLLCGSDLLTAMSPHQMRVEIQAGLIQELPVVMGKTVRRIGLTLRDGAMLSPAGQVLLDNIRRQSALLAGSAP